MKQEDNNNNDSDSEDAQGLNLSEIDDYQLAAGDDGDGELIGGAVGSGGGTGGQQMLGDDGDLD